MNYINTYFKQGKLTFAIAFAFLWAFNVNAQDELPRHYKKYEMSLKANGAQRGAKPVSYTITEEGATWLRLFFSNINLGNSSSVTITSNLDGSSQTLDAQSIKAWNAASAYFNGNSVTVTLNASSRDKAVGVDVVELGVGELAPSTRSQCGSVDNRTSSNDAAIGRIVPIGCTGWIITNGKLVTAGHCTGSRAQILEFNVPQSNSNGSIVHPAVRHQYPIGNFVTPYVRGRPETDWAVFTASANSQTGLTPIQAQNKSYNVVQSAPGSSITITGYGVDTGSDNQTQQTHTGPTASVNNTFVRYQTDTEGGNSGSPIIDAASGNAVGVHAYGGCRTSGTGSNYGARATISAFWNAMGLGNTPPPTCTTLDFNDFSINSFSNQDAAGNFSITNGGSSLVLTNNTWKYIPLNYNVTSNTVIEFQFSSTSQGEIHGVGFENDNSLTSSRYFRVYGTQNYGVGNYDNYSSGTRTYVIPVGNFYTGSADRLVFINDKDAGSSGNNSTFSNVKIYEGSCGSSSAANLRQANVVEEMILGNEPETMLNNVTVGSNLASGEVTVKLGVGNTTAKATIFNLMGQPKGTLTLNSGLNKVATDKLHLPTGVYLIKIERNGESITQ
ncbi:MAG TPA: hypothetical protein DCS93_34240, partial [Microscillaceae bacterium]|nr:hypothetical protein [Microscillaceae bacterium]